MLVGTCLGLFILMLDSTVVAPGAADDREGPPRLRRQRPVGAERLSAGDERPGGDRRPARRHLRAAPHLPDRDGGVRRGLGPGRGGLGRCGLVAARAVQGAGGAAMLSLSLAIVSHAFPVEQQGQALGIWAAVSALALAIGPLVGGALIDGRLAADLLDQPADLRGRHRRSPAWAAHESRDETSRPRLDIPGWPPSRPGLFLRRLRAGARGRLGLGIRQDARLARRRRILLAAFWVIEHRVRLPDRRLQPLPERPLPGRLAAAFALVGAYWGVIFFEPQYLQEVLDHGPVAAGFSSCRSPRRWSSSRPSAAR